MFHLVILNNQEIIYEGMAATAILPGEEEELSILPFHRPIISRLKKGTISIEKEKSEKAEGIPIKGGVARMGKNELVILVE